MVGKKSAINPEALRKFSFFASFSNNHLKDIAKTAPNAACKKGEIVFRHGELSATMYLILKGAVKIEREDSEGAIISVGQLSANQVFGELAMLSKEPRQATVTVCFADGSKLVDPGAAPHGTDLIIDGTFVSGREAWDMRLGDDGIWRAHDAPLIGTTEATDVCPAG